MSETPALPAPPGPARPHRPRRRRWPFVAGALLVVALALFLPLALRIRALAARHATGPSWSFPARVWSADLPLVPGAELPEDYLRAELEARGYREVGQPRRPGEWAVSEGGAELWLRGSEAIPLHAPRPERVRLRLAAGRIASVERLDPAPRHAGPPALEPVLLAVLADSNHVDREYVPLARIPKALQLAVIASEDRRFRSHWGLDLKGNARAIAANLRAGGVRQGASTITQQLARGLFLGNARTFSRKLNEMVLALALERVLSKDRILEMYLNSVYFGRDEAGGIGGVAEASRRFFGVPVDSLTLDQAALLVGVVPAPNLYSPLRRPENALHRRRLVLRDMLETGAIDAAAYEAAARRPLRLDPQLPPPERFPSFVGYVRQACARELPRGALEGWGLSLVTTVDPVWQQDAEEGLAGGVQDQELWRGRSAGRLEGAFVLLDAPTGEVRALVGGRDPGRGDFNRATMALRQPGSAIKPIVYAAALDSRRGGERLTPATTLSDLRRTFETPQGPWNPRNDEGDYHDTVTLAKALAKSLNVATANLVEKIGANVVARYAERFGLGRPEAVASIGLGTHEVTPLALTDAYSVFANGGWRREPTPLRAAYDGRGAVLPLRAHPPIDVLPDADAAIARGLLEDVVIFGISYPLRADYGFTRPCGAKTGTTNDYHDAWFVGFTPRLAAGVWIGYDQPQSLTRPAAKVAIPVWARIMNRVLAGFPPTDFPPRRDVTTAWIDPFTGGLARRDCPSPLRVDFLSGTEPRAFCTRDHTADWQGILARETADSLADAARDSAATADSLARADQP
ncbi:MAG TPA: transglycosylase domain-containing protein [Candidatus Acidoferrales bacterium]|nr:transglycosylase domain-containing protein [Candidatus Acidoferrales bacterium]